MKKADSKFFGSLFEGALPISDPQLLFHHKKGLRHGKH
jgi:hypothetical protein